MNTRTIRNLSIALFALLILWGIYTYLVYLGVPLHAVVFLSPEEIQTYTADCEGAVCRGINLFFPTIGAFFSMLRPFYTYIILSLFAFGGMFFVQGLRTGRFEFPFKLRPLYLIGFFFLSVWLVGVSLTFSASGSGENAQPFRRFYEPIQALYPSLGEEGIAELKMNYQELLDRNCLAPLTMRTADGQFGQAMTQNGAKVYTLKFLCIQTSFFARAGTQFVLILFFLFNLLVAGRLLLRLFKLHTIPAPLQLIFSFGLGAFAWVALLWLLSLLSLLKGVVLIPLCLGLPIVAFTESRYWLRLAWNSEIHLERGKYLWPLLVWVLISYVAFNFLNVIRPFPIGWDDLGAYLNRPRQLASYGSYIPTIAAFQWEYLTSTAFTIFGLDSIIGSTFAMIINWSAGLIAVIVTYVATRAFLGKHSGILAAMLYYFLPMTGHFSFADMKIDNASYFVSVLAILSALLYIFGTPGYSEHHRVERGNRSFLILSGILISFSFAIKPTAVLALFMIISIITGAFFGPFGFAAAALGSFIPLGLFAPFDLHAIIQKIGYTLPLSSDMVRTVSAGSFAVLALIAFGFGLRGKVHSLRDFAISLCYLLIGFVIAAAPWMVHNLLSNNTLNAGSLLGHANTLAPYVTYLQKEDVPADLPVGPEKIRYLPADLKLDPAHAACVSSARTEELDRYWGFSGGFRHYLTLPWRAVMNLDAGGYYVTLIPTLLLFPLLLLLPYFWSKEGRWLRLLFAGTLVFLLQWMFTANGIMWYGIAMFFGFAVGLETLYKKAPDKMSRIVMGTLITFGLMIAIINRLWQYDVQRNIFEYPLGKINASAIREVTIPDYDRISESVVERHESIPDRPYTYRMGTFIPYFIPKNIEILPLADNQVQFFNCINQERDHALTTRRLKALGFNGIIFDTNTATIERDPNGPLHQKVQAFLNYANDTVGSGVVPYVNNSAGGIVYLLLP